MSRGSGWGKCRKVSSIHYHDQCLNVFPGTEMSFSIPNTTDADALVSTYATYRDSRVLTLLLCVPPSWPFPSPRIHAWRHRGRPEGQRTVRRQPWGWLGLRLPSRADRCPWTKLLFPEACFPLGDFFLHCQLDLSVNVLQICPHKLSICFSPTVSTD